jgi:endonuclease III
MGSMFDMNHKRVCPTCHDNHSPSTKCSHDLLVQTVLSLNLEKRALIQQMKETIAIAQTFQGIIRQIEPELARLIAAEIVHKSLSGDKTNVAEKLSAQSQEAELLTNI